MLRKKGIYSELTQAVKKNEKKNLIDGRRFDVVGGVQQLNINIRIS